MMLTLIPLTLELVLAQGVMPIPLWCHLAQMTPLMLVFGISDLGWESDTYPTLIYNTMLFLHFPMTMFFFLDCFGNAESFVVP